MSTASPLLPSDNYLCEFSDSLLQLSRRGRRLIAVTLTVITAHDPQYVGQTLRDWLIMDGMENDILIGSLDHWQLKGLGSAVDGLEAAENLTRDSLARLLIGRQTGVAVTHKDDPQGVRRVIVNRYWHPDDAWRFGL